jgi:hypothetical protein
MRGGWLAVTQAQRGVGRWDATALLVAAGEAFELPGGTNPRPGISCIAEGFAER